MIHSYLNVCVVSKLATRLNCLGFIINVNLEQAVMVLLVLILMTTETQGSKVSRKLNHSHIKATCNEIKSISSHK